MYTVQLQNFIAVLMLTEACLVAASALAAWMLPPALPNVEILRLLGIICYMIFVVNFFLLKLGLYAERRPPSYSHTLRRVAGAVALSSATLGLTFYSLDIVGLPPLYLVKFTLCLFLLLAASRSLLDFVLEHLIMQRMHSRRIVIAGSGRRADLIAKLLTKQRSWGHRLIGFLAPDQKSKDVIYGLPRLGVLDDMEKVLTEQVVDEVIFALTDNSLNIREHLNLCERLGVTYRIIPAMFDPNDPHQLKVDTIQGIPTLSKSMLHFNPSGYIYKRILDYLGGLVGFLFLCLIYPAVALAIRLDSPGPVFFNQPRVGRHGRIFNIYKFRTMLADAEQRKKQLLAANEMNGALFKIADDPRVTRVGRFLRRTSLDEMPQFINVLRGEMSLVGPRPPTPDEVASYQIHQCRRLSVRPGITGLWQVSGRSNLKDFEHTVELDLAYIDGWRFWDDVMILLRTVLVVFRGDGAV
jgi:exopolysaccharide biosynthesis polyprenyl glycosylphosphotransferase